MSAEPRIAEAIAAIVPEVVRGCAVHVRGAVVASAGMCAPRTELETTTLSLGHEAALVLFHDAALEGLAARLASVTAQHVAALLERERAATEREDALSMIAHELRSPLQALTMGTHLLTTRLRGTADEVPREWLLDRCEKLERSTRRLVALSETMLDAARGGLPANGGEADEEEEEEPIDVGAVVDDVVGTAAADLAWAASAVTVTKSGDLSGRWNRLYVDRIVTNLLSNAAKYGSGKPVAVEVSGAADAVVIRVRDQGPGIPASDVNRIFRRFFRGANATRAGGLGVGLWIVDSFVRQLGGIVTCESEVGRGTTFVVHLPRPLVTTAASAERDAPSR